MPFKENRIQRRRSVGSAEKSKRVFELRMERMWTKFTSAMKRSDLPTRNRRLVLDHLQKGLQWIENQAVKDKWNEKSSPFRDSVKGGKKVSPTPKRGSSATTALQEITNAGAPNRSSLSYGGDDLTTPKPKPGPARPAMKSRKTPVDVLRSFHDHLYRQSKTLREMYRSIDLNSSNRVSFHELWRKMESFNLAGEADQKAIYDLAQQYMITTPGCMTYNEFASFFCDKAPPKVSKDSWRIPQSRKEFLQVLEKTRTKGKNGKLLRAIFLRMDVDGDNLLSFKELCDYFSSHNVPSDILTDPRFGEFVAGYTHTRPGYLTYPEFMTFVHQSKPPQSGKYLMEVDHRASPSTLLKQIQTQIDNKGLRLKRGFQLFDTNNDGYLDEAELFHALGELNIFAPRNVIKNLFNKLDKNQDGHVEYFELIRGIADETRKEAAAKKEEAVHSQPVFTPAPANKTPSVKFNNFFAEKKAEPERPFSRQTESSFSLDGKWAGESNGPSPMTARKHKSNYPHVKDNINIFQKPKDDRVIVTEDDRILAEISRQIYSNSSSGLRIMFNKLCSSPRYLTWEDFKSSLRRFGLRYPEEPLQRLWKRFDLNGDGRLSYSQFVRMLAVQNSPKK